MGESGPIDDLVHRHARAIRRHGHRSDHELPGTACDGETPTASRRRDRHSDAEFGKSVPPAPTRYDIAPNPPDRFIDVIGDISKMSGVFSLAYG